MTLHQEFVTGRVVRRRDLNPSLMILWIEPQSPIPFKPGQYVTLGIDGIERPYSIASAPHERLIELFLELAPTDLQTPDTLTVRLFQLQPGHEVTLRPKAKGGFLLDPHYDVQVLVSTVTGVAPYVSMLRAYAHRTAEHPDGYYGRRFKRVYVFQGASYQDEFGYAEELSALAEADFTILYRNTVSQIPGLEREPGRNRGWVADERRHDILRVNRNLLWYFGQYGIRPDDATCVYVCGHGGMVNDLTFGSARAEAQRVGASHPAGQLVQLGYHVHKETYF
ncbi:MAG: hypothetical protein IT371_16410 [Deltaproteobacteria bacterium]|nr:hypothetical protein [Deltaproteobacteria bacterium]